MKTFISLLLGVLMGLGYVTIGISVILFIYGLFNLESFGGAEFIVLLILLLIGILFVYISRKIKLKE